MVSLDYVDNGLTLQLSVSRFQATSSRSVIHCFFTLNKIDLEQTQRSCGIEWTCRSNTTSNYEAERGFNGNFVSAV